MSDDEICRIAQSLAKNCGYPVFPCLDSKYPARPKSKGGQGYKDATTDSDEIAWLWEHWPGPLIGVATGARSGISLLDIDIKHDTARAWWVQNNHRIPVTRINRTRSGGLHLPFLHAPGVRNTEGKPVPGIDVRGDGGYMIWWPAAGLEILDHSIPTPWPEWLFQLLWPPPKLRPFVAVRPAPLSDRDCQRIQARALDMVRQAADGQKHNHLRSAARLLGGIQHHAGFSDTDAIEWLVAVLPPGVRDEQNARRTAAWGLASGRTQPIEFHGRRS